MGFPASLLEGLEARVIIVFLVVSTIKNDSGDVVVKLNGQCDGVVMYGRFFGQLSDVREKNDEIVMYEKW